MSWLLILLAAAAFAVAFFTTSMVLAVVCLLASLAFLIAGVMGLLAQRVDSRSRDEASMIDPVELRRLREQAEARRVAAQAGEPQPGRSLSGSPLSGDQLPGA
jgi:Zn-dependent protease with chaperone function